MCFTDLGIKFKAPGWIIFLTHFQVKTVKAKNYKSYITGATLDIKIRSVCNIIISNCCLIQPRGDLDMCFTDLGIKFKAPEWIIFLTHFQVKTVKAKNCKSYITGATLDIKIRSVCNIIISNCCLI